MKFSELVKKIHPDHSPGTEDAGEKIALAKRHRDDPAALRSLAVGWGLVGPEPPAPSAPTYDARAVVGGVRGCVGTNVDVTAVRPKKRRGV
jgi:hypothetical protein